jgi:predicted nuclease with TOPRIM domain
MSETPTITPEQALLDATREQLSAAMAANAQHAVMLRMAEQEIADLRARLAEYEPTPEVTDSGTPDA